jgi:hypothetical protein
VVGLVRAVLRDVAAVPTVLPWRLRGGVQVTFSDNDGDELLQHPCTVDKIPCSVVTYAHGFRDRRLKYTPSAKRLQFSEIGSSERLQSSPGVSDARAHKTICRGSLDQQGRGEWSKKNDIEEFFY